MNQIRGNLSKGSVIAIYPVRSVMQAVCVTLDAPLRP